MKYDVTIGIPIYNVEGYIQRALESALAQTYPSIEFLLLDDGSGDNSAQIIQGLRSNHPRGAHIRMVVHEQNLGVSEARNRILEEAQGDYLYFMDSDDLIFENTISLLMEHIKAYQAEIAFGSFEKIAVSGKRSTFQYPEKVFGQEDALANYAYRKYGGIQASSCNYLVKMSVIRENGLRFCKSNYWEDMVFTLDLVTYIKRAVLVPDITYSYRCRENSLSNFQYRATIDKSEILSNVRTVEYMKEGSIRLKGKPYYPNRCYIAVMTDFYMICNVLKNRSRYVPHISNVELRSYMLHPASLRSICAFRQMRWQNLFLFLLTKLPSFLFVRVVWLIGRYRKLI